MVYVTAVKSQTEGSDYEGKGKWLASERARAGAGLRGSFETAGAGTKAKAKSVQTTLSHRALCLAGGLAR